MSISRLPFCSTETVDVASKAMSHARSALQTTNTISYASTASTWRKQTAEDHPGSSDALQPHLYNGLTCPAGTIPFLHGSGLAYLQASPCWYRNGSVHVDRSTWTVCWPTAIIPVSNLMLAQERQTGVLSHSRAQYKGVLCTQDRYRDTSKNIMLPLKAT